MTVAALEALTGALAAWLAARSANDASDVEIGELTRAPSGQSNDTVLVTVSIGERVERLVVRRQSTANSIFLEPDVLREARVLEGLAGADVPVPRVRWTEVDPTVLGAPFFVMDRVDGRVPVGKPSIHSVGWLPTLTTAERERLWASALDALVAVHDVAWRTSHRFLLDGDPETPTVVGQVRRLADWYRWTTRGREFPVTDAAVEHLEHDAPSISAGEPVLVWGDARVGNMIFGDHLTVDAVIDWETATIGPAARDVAHWLFFDAFGTDAIGVERLGGWPDRETTIRRYEQASRRSLGDLSYFSVMEELFMATTLIRQADARVAKGLAPPDTRMGHDNTVTQMLARRLGLPVPGLSPDYVAHRGLPVPKR